MTFDHIMKNKIFVVSITFLTAYFSILSVCYALPNNLPNVLPNNYLPTTSNVPNNYMTEDNKSSMQFSDFERLIAAKMALDIRYFCPTLSSDNSEPTMQIGQCLQPMTKLPKALADMVTATSIGSVVLFAENLASTEQIIRLTHDLQQAAMQSQSGQPLIISIDQEGGRVVRLPHATSFAGNMAIGATYPANGVKFAAETSTVIAKELKVLGINNNYAPVVDVNTNADNPVINTRSFGEDPQRVAELGSAAVNGFQQHGIMATLKHFPGHGDTHVDSHLGLPIVEHDLATIEKQDLAPFQWVIKHSDPAMIMTAHIQYPALDDSTIENIAGDKIIRPATMSRKILTDLLRHKMAFDGIIATDALDMAGIARYFDEVTAVVETFIAGADIAVMPFKIRQEEDIEKFYDFIKAVAQALKKQTDGNGFLSTELAQSLVRINRYKAKYCQLPATLMTKQITLAEQTIATAQHLALEQALADNAVYLLINNQEKVPIDVANVNRIHVFVLNWQEFRALKQAIMINWQKTGKTIPQISATVVSEGDTHAQLESGEKLAKADLVIATIDTKIASVVDIGGAEDMLAQNLSTKALDKVSYGQLLRKQLQRAKQQQVSSILIAKGSPYLVQPYVELADTILITFDDRIYQQQFEQHEEGQAYSPGYNTSMAIVVGEQEALGRLPVSLK